MCNDGHKSRNTWGPGEESCSLLLHWYSVPLCTRGSVHVILSERLLLGQQGGGTSLPGCVVSTWGGFVSVRDEGGVADSCGLSPRPTEPPASPMLRG